MKRKDCAYCIDLDEQCALCDHPLRLDCGEPVEARCSSRCADYERRMSVTEALSRIHDLEAKLAESEKFRAGYADMLIPLKAENAKLRELVLLMYRYIAESCAVQYPYPPEPVSYLSLLETEKLYAMTRAGIRQGRLYPGDEFGGEVE